MSKLVKALGKKQTVIKTENGAKTFSSSLNACLDLFFMIGALRNRSEQDIITLFTRAYVENKDLALKILAYARDPRGGMGERRVFRTIIKHLQDSNKNVFYPNYIGEIGRWDDLLCLNMTNEILDVILNQISVHNNGLCAKWMPRQGKIANLLRNRLGQLTGKFISPKDWRKLLVSMTNVVETKMCNREWAGIEYSHVPSMANLKYNSAFLRHDEERRREFLAKAEKGEVKINSSVAFPSDILKKYMPGGRFPYRISRDSNAEAMWKQLPDYLTKKDMNILPVCDTSGSMNGDPLLTSVALGLYISERNNGIFKDAYVTFSNEPTIVHTKGDLYQRILQMPRIHPASTDLEKTFKVILKTAINNKLKQKDMPTHLLIISDMEFDTACRKPNATLYKNIKTHYKEAGYKMPNIIFWNVNSRQDNVPVRFNQDGVGLISGKSPAVMKAVLSGDINPVDIMMRAVDIDKYKRFVKWSNN